MGNLAASELILNPNGSIYHLNLLPENLASTVITVGDPDRVGKVTRYFDKVEFQVQKREFHTQTGYYRGKRISVISTGIGTDNIDIVMNELDALANIDLKTRKIKEKPVSLDIIRIGTSGSLHEEIPIDAFLLSELAVGFDSLLHYYDSAGIQLQEFNEAVSEQLQLFTGYSSPYVVSCDETLAKKFSGQKIYRGFTGTNVGFYAPQGRVLRLKLKDPDLNDKIARFSFRDKKITNLEMETAGIYGLAKLMGHRAVSLNAMVANRATGEFSQNPSQTVKELIEFALDALVPENSI